MKTLIIATSGILLPTSGAMAQACNPVDILQKDTQVRILHDDVGYTYAQQVSSSKASADAKAGKIGFAIKGVPIEVGLSTANSVASLVQSKTNMTYSREEFQYLLHKYLSQNGVDAYKACLQQQNLTIDVPTNADTYEAFDVTVRWSQPFTANDTQLTLTSSNGDFLVQSANDPTVTVKSPRITVAFTSGSSRVFSLSGRALTKPTSIAGVLSSQTSNQTLSTTLLIPSHIPYTIKSEVRESSPPTTVAVNYREGNTLNRRERVCINKSLDGVLIPETARWSNMKYVRAQRTSETIEKDSNDTNQVCGLLHASGWSGGSVSVEGTLSVTEVKVERISETAPTAER